MGFDYKSATCADDIRRYTKNSLRYVLDRISDEQSMRFCHACIERAGGRYTALEPYPHWLQSRTIIRGDWVLQPTVLGKRIGWPAPFAREVGPEICEWAAAWVVSVQKLRDDEELKTHPVTKMPGGLQGILDGMDLLRNKKVSGTKLVYLLFQ